MSSVYLRAPLPRCLSHSLARVGMSQANCHHPAPKLLASRVSQVRTGTSFRPRKLHAATAGQPHAPHHRQPLPPAFATAPIPHHRGSSWQKPKRHTARTRIAPPALVTQSLSLAHNHTTFVWKPIIRPSSITGGALVKIHNSHQAFKHAHSHTSRPVDHSHLKLPFS